MGSGFPIDLVLFGMIAAFLVLRLRGILGRRTGFERQPGETPGGKVTVPGMARGPVIEGRAEPAPGRKLPEPGSPAGAGLARMAAAERGFDAGRFLQGAEAAFRLIVAGFAAGDRVALRPLLTDETYRSFESAIAGREAAGETQRSEVRSIEQATIEDAALDGMLARITVRFVSDQVAETLSQDGRPVAGADAVAETLAQDGRPVAGADAVAEITDLWTFERMLGQADPAWRLAAARSA